MEKINKNKTIVFKSVEPYLSKEISDIKNNSVREFQKGFKDPRETILKYWLKKPFELYYGILDFKNNKTYYKKVRDVTKYNNLYIITWWPEEK